MALSRSSSLIPAAIFCAFASCSGVIFPIMACAAFIINGFPFMISTDFCIIAGSIPIAFTRSISSGPILLIWSRVLAKSSGVIALNCLFMSSICSGLIAGSPPAPTVVDWPLASPTVASSSSSRDALARASEEFGSRASSMRSSSNSSFTSTHTFSKLARSTRPASPFFKPDPASQHSSSSARVKSESFSPTSAAMGAKVAKARKVTPPLAGLLMYSAALNMTSMRTGSAALPRAESVFDAVTARTVDTAWSTAAEFTSFMADAASSIWEGDILDICSCASRLDSTISSGVIFSIICCALFMMFGFSCIIFMDIFIIAGSMPIAASCSF
mmetsp:Transcript_2729/g.4633  ORF Transcript_2729/g.4633 Transcript_2729/m.4633 type:complete len:329 (+) Transcript_2729:190-1176(+)